MLPSAGFFTELDCPFYRRDLCQRPHCMYKHAKDEGTMFDTLCGSTITTAAVQNNHSTPFSGAPQNKEANNACLLELERINKEIETVKNEVEKEQRRLSRYQTVQLDCGSTASKKVFIPKSETAGNDLNGNHPKSAHKQPTKPYSAVRKYVVDNSKPRTDLEYDPLSNFSADLRSSGSSEYKPGNEQKVKGAQGVKRTRENVLNDQTKPLSQQLVVDSEEEGELIIDVPPLESDSKRARSLKPPKTTTEVHDHDVMEEVKPAPIVAHIPLPVLAIPEVSDEAVKDDINDTKDPSNVSVSQGNKYNPSAVSVFDDLSKCLENLRSESERMVSYEEAEPIVENNSGTEPECPKTGASSQICHHTDPVVKENVGLLMAESVFLKRDLPSSCVEQTKPLPPNEVSHGHVASLPPNGLIPSSVSANQLTTECQVSEQSAVQGVAQSYWSPLLSAPTVPCVQKIPGQTTVLAYSGLANPLPPANYLASAAATAGIIQCQIPNDPSTSNTSHVTDGEEVPSASFEQSSMEAANELPEAVPFDSSSEEEVNYSDLELSDSDPMEECYRIFMEAKKDEEASTEQACTPTGVVDSVTPEVAVKAKALPGQRKRVAHAAKFTEPVAKSKPVVPQVIVPLRETAAAPQLTNPSKMQLMQQRASMLTTTLKGGQAFLSSSIQRKVVTLATPHHPTHHPTHHPAPLQNACMNFIPVGTAIQVGNNLHFILPEGSYAMPITSVATPVTPVYTPVTPVHTPAAPVYNPVTPVHTPAAPVYNPVTPVHIPVATVPVPPQHASYIPAKAIPTKRKAKQRPEVSTKVPHDVRQRYVNIFVEEFLKTSVTVQDAFEKALAEEKTVYDRSTNKFKYLSVAVNALKRLKNQSTTSVKAENETDVQMSRGNIPLNTKALWRTDAALYESLKEHILSDEMLRENNYPLQHPEKPGSAVLYGDSKKGITDPMKRICCRCGATYSVSRTGNHTRKEECNYHHGKGVENKGGVESRYSCCEGVVGTPGCQVFKLHVHDAVSLDGFVRTLPRPASEKSCPGVFSVDCEMCYTTQGLELARVTVVNSSVQVIYDTFVIPDNEVIDYNTRFSGISEDDVKGTSSSIRDVQEALLSFISADTILIGHGLDTDLSALKLLHGTVIDTSVVFPHRLGLPHKLTLHNLTADYLRRIIQESAGGHNSAEDATACMELMLWKVKEDGKVKRW